MLIDGTHLGHLCCSFPPPVSCPCSFAVGHLPQSRDGWAVRVSYSVKPGHVTQPPIMQPHLSWYIRGAPSALFCFNQPQQRSGDKHWGQGGVGAPQVAMSGYYMSWYLSPMKQFSAMFVGWRQHVEQQTFRASGSYNSKSVSGALKPVVCHL